MTPFDMLVITAANAQQARGYRAELKARQADGRLKLARDWRVLPDPGGRRVGSGGSTLAVLAELAEAWAPHAGDAPGEPASLDALFRGRRIAIVHSGGDSRRLCAYAAQGKVFTPLPCDADADQPAALFDLILRQLAGLPAPTEGQTLIAAGDVLLTFDAEAVDFSRPGVTGVAYPGPIERARQHGVYVADDTEQVTDFLQKPDADEAREHGAIDSVGRLLIDTGLISLDPTATARWLTAAGLSLKPATSRKRGGAPLAMASGSLLDDIRNGEAQAIDLYQEILMALPPGIDEDDYLRRAAPKADRAQRLRLGRLRKTLREDALHVSVLPWCEFFHIGTSRELLENVNTLGRTASRYGFANHYRSHVREGASLEGAFVFNSVIENADVRANGSAYVEAVHARSAVELDGRTILVGLPGGASRPVRLAEGWGMVVLPVGKADHWAAVSFGVEDDFKTDRHHGGTLGNQTLDVWLDHAGLAPGDLWTRSQPQTLWHARLWTVGPIDEALDHAAWLRQPDGQPPAALRKARRYAMADLIARVNHERLIAHRRELQRLGGLHDLDHRLAADPRLSADSVVQALRSPEDVAIVTSAVDAAIRRASDPLARARGHALLQAVAESDSAGMDESRAAKAQQQAFAAITQAVARSVSLPTEPRPAAIQHDQVVWATTPARIDLAGGWSDTPPICTELGGAVVNAAVTLNGQYPIQVIAKLNEERAIRLTSIDLGSQIRLTRTRELLDHTDPSRWDALAKAALVLSGVAPREAGDHLEDWLDALGGGLDLTLFSALPKGSGMGGSSILGAALLAALARVVGEPLSTDQLIARTSLLEQLMTTMGGWQDQAGAITPGVKLMQTAPGPEQIPLLHWAPLDFAAIPEARERMLLYYTGQKRLARNILQKVVTRYLRRDPEALAIVDRLKRLAVEAKDAIDRRDLDALAASVDEYWRLKQALDPGSSNPAIDALLAGVRRWVAGATLTGAGGGGFCFLIARSPKDARSIREHLERRPPNDRARFFDFDIDPQGLRIAVL